MQGGKLANTKSCEKRIRQNEKRRSRNSQMKSSVRTSVKKVVKAVEVDKNQQSANELLQSFIKRIDAARRKGIIHYKTADRKKSRLTKRVNKMNSPAAQ